MPCASQSSCKSSRIMKTTTDNVQVNEKNELNWSKFIKQACERDHSWGLSLCLKVDENSSWIINYLSRREWQIKSRLSSRLKMSSFHLQNGMDHKKCDMKKSWAERRNCEQRHTTFFKTHDIDLTLTFRWSCTWIVTRLEMRMVIGNRVISWGRWKHWHEVSFPNLYLLGKQSTEVLSVFLTRRVFRDSSDAVVSRGNDRLNEHMRKLPCTESRVFSPNDRTTLKF